MLRNRKPTLVQESCTPRWGGGGALALAGFVGSRGAPDAKRFLRAGKKSRHTHMTWMAASRDMMVHSVLEDKADKGS